MEDSSILLWAFILVQPQAGLTNILQLMLLIPVDSDVQGDICRLYILTGEDAIYTTPGTRPSGRPVTIILAESAVRVCVPVGYVLKGNTWF